MSVSCEFGSCGNGFSAEDPNNSQNDHISGVINFGVALDAVWGGISGVAKYAGCGVVGVGKGTQSFFGLTPLVNNGPPGPSSGLRAARGAYKIGAPGIMYRLSRLGPVGRAAGDLIPGLGELLLYGQGALAVNDGSRAAYECGSKVQ